MLSVEVSLVASVVPPAPSFRIILTKSSVPGLNLVAFPVGSVMNHPLYTPPAPVVNSPYSPTVPNEVLDVRVKVEAAGFTKIQLPAPL